jgi:hypothetical protein
MAAIIAFFIVFSKRTRARLPGIAETLQAITNELRTMNSKSCAFVLET